MGAAASRVDRPQVVLVPPRLERELPDYAALARPPLDPAGRAFAQEAKRRLFSTYLAEAIRGDLRLKSPDADVALWAALNAPLGGRPCGNVRVLWTPAAAASPYSFVDMEINTNEGRDPRKETSYVRACLHHPASRLAVFGRRQLYANRRRLRSIDDVDNEGPVNYVGCRLAGKHLGIGACLDPTGAESGLAWLAARAGGLTAAVQYRLPKEHLAPESFREFGVRELLREGAKATRSENVRAGVSWTTFGRTGQPSFTATAVSNAFRALDITLLHHLTVRRKVHDPFEGPDVVGITNYITLGVELSTRLGGGQEEARGGGGREPPVESNEAPTSIALAASWQMNRSLKVVGKLGMEGMKAAVVTKSWWTPSLTAAASMHLAFDRMEEPRYGFVLSTENWGGTVRFGCLPRRVGAGTDTPRAGVRQGGPFAGLRGAHSQAPRVPGGLGGGGGRRRVRRRVGPPDVLPRLRERPPAGAAAAVTRSNKKPIN